MSDLRTLVAKLQGGGSVAYDDMRALEEAMGGLDKMQYQVQSARGEHPGESAGDLGVLPPGVLSQLDRYTHGAAAAQSNPFHNSVVSPSGLPGIQDLLHGGLMTGVFAASEAGKALGLGKAMSAATRATGLGEDINFFDQDQSTSPPSLDNITSVVKGYFRGTTNRSENERRKIIEKIKGLSPAERLAAALRNMVQ